MPGTTGSSSTPAASRTGSSCRTIPSCASGRPPTRSRSSAAVRIALVDLHPGERIIYEGHPSWRSILRFYILGLLLVAAAAAIGAVANGPGISVAAGVAVLLIVLLVGWLKRVMTRYLITTKRLQIRRGILSKRVEESRVDRVVDVTVHQSILARMLAIGDVDFDNASAQQGDLFRFAGVAHPHQITDAINRVHEETSSSTRPETTV